MFMSCMLRSELRLKAYQLSTGHFLILHLQEQRVIKSKCLLQCYANSGQRRILFTDENIFNIEEVFNHLNDRVNASTFWEAPRIQRGYHPVWAMVWWGVVYDATTRFHFCKKGWKPLQSLWEHHVGACCEAFEQHFVQIRTLELSAGFGTHSQNKLYSVLALGEFCGFHYSG